MESKESRQLKEKGRKKFCDEMIKYESVYIQNAYNCDLLDTYKLYVWFTVHKEIITESGYKNTMSKVTRETIKKAKKGEKKLTKELIYNPKIINTYNMNKKKREIFTGRLDNKNLKSDLSPELTDRMLYKYAEIKNILGLFDKKELIYIYSMAFVDDEKFIDILLNEKNIVDAYKKYIVVNNEQEKFGKNYIEKILNVSKSSIYNYFNDLKNKKSIEARTNQEVCKQLNKRLYSNIKVKKCMMFRIEEVERTGGKTIISFEYGGISEDKNKKVNSKLRTYKLECDNVEKELYNHLLDKAKRDNKIVVIDYSSVCKEKKIIKAMDYLAMFKYNIYLKI